MVVVKQQPVERWHFLDKRSKAIAYRGLKLEFATHRNAEIGRRVLDVLEAERVVLVEKAGVAGDLFALDDRWNNTDWHDGAEYSAAYTALKNRYDALNVKETT